MLDNIEETEPDDQMDEQEGEDNEDELIEAKKEARERIIHEAEPDNPVLQELNERLDAVAQTGSLDQMRNLHRELHVRHVTARREAVKRITNLI